MSDATVVVTLGAVWFRDEGVGLPAKTSIGVVGSTPENARIPPADPVDVENVQL